jgi:hypothetical protein
MDMIGPDGTLARGDLSVAPEKADITKWIMAGGSATELQEIVAATSDWGPLTVETSDSVASAKGITDSTDGH